MKCVCYYHDPKDPAYPKELISAWETSWTRNGFDCHLLTEEDAKLHPMFEQLEAHIARLPTVCGRDYERACWLRWLAFELAAPAIFSDYDVINFGWTPGDVPIRCNGFTPLHGDHNGASTACVYATRKGIRWFVSEFFKAQDRIITWQGKPHIGDMTLLWQLLRKVEHYPCLHANHPLALSALLVHFQNDTVPEKWKGVQRWKAIRKFESRRSWHHFKRLVFGV